RHGETLQGPNGNREAAFPPGDGGAKPGYYTYCVPVTAGVIMSKERDPSDQTDTPQPGRKPPGTSLTLLQRLLDNEPEAWRTMVQLYTPLLYHWCARGGVRGADAEDVMQEVFRVAASRLNKFRRDREGDSFRGWLRGITRNLLLGHFRRASRQPQASGDSGVL